MKIDNECIRNILLTIEEKTTYEYAFRFPGYYKKVSERLADYGEDKLLYHVRFLLMSGYLFTVDDREIAARTKYYVDLTPAGHDFLNNIRDVQNWNRTKKAVSAVGSLSLKLVAAAAEGLATAALNKQISLFSSPPR